MPHASNHHNGVSKRRPTRHRQSGWRNTRDITAVVRKILSVSRITDREELAKETVTQVQGLLERTPHVHTMDPTQIRRRIYDSVQVMDYLRIISVMIDRKTRYLQWNGMEHVFTSTKLREERPIPITVGVGSGRGSPVTRRQALLFSETRAAESEAKIASEETPEMSPTAIGFVAYEDKSLHDGNTGPSKNSTGGINASEENDIARELFLDLPSDATSNTGSGKPGDSEDAGTVGTPRNTSERCNALKRELSLRRDRIAKKKQNLNNLSTRAENLQKLVDMNKRNPAPPNQRIPLHFAFVVPSSGSTVRGQMSGDKQSMRLLCEDPIYVFQRHEIVERVVHYRQASAGTQNNEESMPRFSSEGEAGDPAGRSLHERGGRPPTDDLTTRYDGLDMLADDDSYEDLFQFDTVEEYMDHVATERERKAFLRCLKTGGIWQDAFLNDEDYIREVFLPDTL